MGLHILVGLRCRNIQTEICHMSIWSTYGCSVQKPGQLANCVEIYKTVYGDVMNSVIRTGNRTHDAMVRLLCSAVFFVTVFDISIVAFNFLSYHDALHIPFSLATFIRATSISEGSNLIMIFIHFW